MAYAVFSSFAGNLGRGSLTEVYTSRYSTVPRTKSPMLMRKQAFYQTCREINVTDGTLKYRDPGFDI